MQAGLRISSLELIKQKTFVCLLLRPCIAFATPYQGSLGVQYLIFYR